MKNLIFILVLSFLKPITGFCAASSTNLNNLTVLQKKNANAAFKLQHRKAKVENFMAKHGGGLADNAGAQLLLFLLITIGTIWLIFWLGSKISGAAIGPIVLIILGIFLLYALYRYGSGKKTLFKNY